MINLNGIMTTFKNTSRPIYTDEFVHFTDQDNLFNQNGIS